MTMMITKSYYISIYYKSIKKYLQELKFKIINNNKTQLRVNKSHLAYIKYIYENL